MQELSWYRNMNSIISSIGDEKDGLDHRGATQTLTPTEGAGKEFFRP